MTGLIDRTKVLGFSYGTCRMDHRRLNWMILTNLPWMGPMNPETKKQVQDFTDRLGFLRDSL
jgi:hypothetical protein